MKGLYATYWMFLWTVALGILFIWYLQHTNMWFRNGYGYGYEGFSDVYGNQHIEMGSLGAINTSGINDSTLILADTVTVQNSPHLTSYTAERVATTDQSRTLEPISQYDQRTNNYKHTYPDNGSAPLSEFVGSVYSPPTAIGETVPLTNRFPNITK